MPNKNASCLRAEKAIVKSTHMKRIAALFLNVVFTLYILSVMLMGTYFNWTNAKQSGFIQWLFPGEVVPTLQALVWPYYIFWHSGSVASGGIWPLTEAQINSVEISSRDFCRLDNLVRPYQCNVVEISSPRLRTLSAALP